jgi:hypothetical protein
MSAAVTFGELTDEAIELLAELILDEAERLLADGRAAGSTKGGAA